MGKDIEHHLIEGREFSPPIHFQQNANLRSVHEYKQFYQESLQEPEKFWRKMTSRLEWFHDWKTMLQWNPPFSQWFVEGKLNACHNCVDRHVEAGLNEKAAIIYESEAGEVQTLTYEELLQQIKQVAAALKHHGVKRGDRVAIYMPMTPQAVIAMLACARIGAVHSVVFGGFSAKALAERIIDAGARVVITADGGYRRGQLVPLKATTDEALTTATEVAHVFVFQNSRQSVSMKPGRDHWLHEIMVAAARPAVEAEKEIACESMNSEDPLFILYTSGSTGKPKGVVHTTGGYLTAVNMTSFYVFDLKPTDIYWCTADIGWITGHSYVVYGPLSNAATLFIYEGAPDYPQPNRFWSMIEKHRVSIFYTAPTAIRAFMKWGDPWVRQHDLSSLRLLGSVGEPINPEAWMWYYNTIGKGNCPVVDTWWQTETGSIMLTTFPGIHKMKPGATGLPMFGVESRVIDKENHPVNGEGGGYLVLERPWPSMLRTIYGDDDRYKKQYWSQLEGKYFTGDGARQDSSGYHWVMGRIDDVINVSGHRLGTAEIESALVSHAAVAEAAVVGKPDELKGESVIAFVCLENTARKEPGLDEELKAHVAREIGALTKPSQVYIVDSLPKTRSGKIMRRLLRSLASGKEELGDLSTLEDRSIIEKLRAEE